MNDLVELNDILLDKPAGVQPVRIGKRGGTTYHPPQKMNYTYERIVDLMLTQPEKTLTQMAQILGYSNTWFSTVTQSDVFKAYYAARRAEYNARLADRVSGKLGAAAEVALDSLIEGIKEKGANMTVTERAEVVDSLMSKLGYGRRDAPTQVNINSGNVTEVIVPVDREVLFQARNSLRAVEELKLARANAVDINAGTVETPAQPKPSGIMSLNVE